MKKPEKYINIQKHIETLNNSYTKQELMNIDFDEIIVDWNYDSMEVTLVKNETIKNKNYEKELIKYQKYLDKLKQIKLTAKDKRRIQYEKLKKEFENDTD